MLCYFEVNHVCEGCLKLPMLRVVGHSDYVAVLYGVLSRNHYRCSLLLLLLLLMMTMMMMMMMIL